MPTSVNAARLSASIKAKRLAKLADDQRVDNAAMQADCDAIAEAMIEELGFLQIAPGIAVATAGTATAQTGATTAPGVVL